MYSQLFEYMERVVICERSEARSRFQQLSNSRGSRKCVMREIDAALTGANVIHAPVDPPAGRSLQMQHCFVASARADEAEKGAFDRIMHFIKQAA